MADVSAFAPSPPAPSPLAADALLAPWTAPLRHGDDRRPNPLFAILPLSALAIGLVLLVAVAVILVLTRRGRLRLAGAVVSVDGDKPGGAPASSCGSSARASHNARCYPAAGCIYGGRLGPLGLAAAQPRSRGAQVFTYRELERATDGFGDGNVLGRGAYGVVYRGRLVDGTPAAIKRLQLDLRRLGEREFRVEVDLLSRMHSPHLVGLLGYCADQSHRLLVFELMPNGTLKSHLHRPAAVATDSQEARSSAPPPALDWQTRLCIALDCARALEFLHEHTSPAVIHRDFNCGNVLLDHNYRARVSDFATAKVGSNKANGQVLTRVLGTTGYLAPEYASTGKLTTKSDVYSYGVVLLELLTGRVPVDTQRPPGQHVLVSWALPRLTNRERLVQMVDPALKGQFAVKDLIQVDLLSRMHSPHLVGLLGYCADQSHRLLVFELMPNGTLKSHLHRPAAVATDSQEARSPAPLPALDWQTRLCIALDCARALEFLHEHTSPAVIHRDFNCGNVLLDHNYRARVSDFATAKVGSNKANGQVLTRVLGTTGYLAPEYASTGKLTTKSDVYSYGVVLLELLTGRVPVDTQRPPGQHVLVSWALPRLTNRERLVQMVDPALKGQFAVKDLIQVGAIAAMCVQTKAEYRPLMTDVVQSLIPIVKKSPVMSCSSTPARPLQHVVYMSPLQKQASVAGKAS